LLLVITAINAWNMVNVAAGVRAGGSHASTPAEGSATAVS
jgi:hypothetical protein